MKAELNFERKTVNRLNHDITRNKLKLIAAVAERNKSFGFTAKLGKLGEPECIFDADTGEAYLYRFTLTIEKEGVLEGLVKAQYENVQVQVIKAAETHGWSLSGQTHSESGSRSPELPEPRSAFVVPELTEEVWKRYFSGLYERDEHVRIMHDSMQAFAHSRMMRKSDPRIKTSRGHVLLKGRPASGKTTLLERFKAWYDEYNEELSGQEAERVLFVDAHVTTKAGLENFLLEKAEANALPDVLALEEIEKQSPENLLSLISVMGSGYISKMNAKIGHRRERAELLVWATCNDEDVIRGFRRGVLWSRFAHHLHCAKPSRALMRRILEDRVIQLGGEPEWVDRVMEFAYSVVPKWTGKPMDDARQIEALLDGRERLSDGSFQKDFLAILRSELEETAEES